PSSLMPSPSLSSLLSFSSAPVSVSSSFASPLSAPSLSDALSEQAASTSANEKSNTNKYQSFLFKKNSPFFILFILPHIKGMRPDDSASPPLIVAQSPCIA